MSVLGASGFLYALVAGLVVMAAFGAALFWLFLRTIQGNAAREGQRAVTPLRDRMVAVMDRADALRGRLDVVMGSDPTAESDAALTGRSAASAKEARDELDAVWEHWGELQTRLEAARDVQAGPGDLGGGQHLLAAEIAEDPELERRAEQALTTLDQVEARINALEDAPVAAAEALDRVVSLLPDLTELPGVASSPALRKEALGLATRYITLSASPWTDPLTLKDDATALHEAVEALLVRN